MLEKNILQGNKGETLFYNLCKRDGYDIRKATPYQNKYQHTDFFVKFKNNINSVDVKSIKKLMGNYKTKNTILRCNMTGVGLVGFMLKIWI